MNSGNKFSTIGQASNNELQNRKRLFELFKNNPMTPTELLNSLGLFTRRQLLSRFLFMNNLYQQILNVHGIICEFGVRWGQNLALFTSLRGIYEPYNYNRKIVGFDTFEGFPNTSKEDGNSSAIKKGAYGVTPGYEDFLEQILMYHETENPIEHIKKFELIKGDATKTCSQYLKDNPETIIAFAYFDFDIYAPTKACLEAILPHITKGTVIGFDELNYHQFPGETLAFNEVIGLNKYRIKRCEFAPTMSYIIID